METALLVDDSKGNAVHTQHNLEANGYHTTVTDNAEECLRLSAQLQPDIILLDFKKAAALGLIRRLKELSQTKTIPVLLISDDIAEKSIIQALDFGAHDCLPKPVVYPVLAARMRSAVRINQANRQLEIANAELTRIATIDPLTRSYNRRHFMGLAHAEFAKAKRYKRPLSVIMLDVDDFKSVNDSYGHPAGDKALMTLAECCDAAVRESDIVGRIGGEEFAMCCPDADVQGAQAIAERIRRSCESITLEYDGYKFSFTVSLGVTHMTALDDDFEKLICRADKLLYKAKHQGRNCSMAC